MTNIQTDHDLYVGLSGLNLGDREIDFGHGIFLRPTYAHVFTTDILAFERPATPHSYHPGPWQASSHKKGIDISAQLVIPRQYKRHKTKPLVVAETIVTILRIWTDPEISIQLITDAPIPDLKHREYIGPTEAPVAMLVAGRDRHIRIGLESREKIIDSIDWVVKHWEDAFDLRMTSSEFDFALETFDKAQLIPNSAMMLVSLWGALEAVFAQSKSELRFRISAQIAAFLAPRGQARLDKQRDVMRLYDKRSAAAHGNPKHGPDELIQTFELLRQAIIRMIMHKSVPSKSQLEELIFCG